MDLVLFITLCVAAIAIIALGVLLGQYFNLDKKYKILEKFGNELSMQNMTLEANIKHKDEMLNEQKARYEKDLSDLNVNLSKFYEANLQKVSAELLNLNAKEISQHSSNIVSEVLEKEIKPLREAMDKYSKENVRLNAIFDTNFQALSKATDEIGKKTAQLASALRGNKKIVGNWGETQLELVLENSGLKEGQNYQKQVYYVDDDGKKRFLDVVVDFGVNKKAVIDAKCSLVHYLDYINASDNDAKITAIKELAKDLKNHIDILAPKDYQKYSKDVYDYVFMFIPNENILQLAMQSNSNLYQYAYEKGIFLTTPLTMLMALRTVYLCWQNLKMDENSRQILELAGNLYDKFYGFVLDFDTIERNISTLSKTYENAKNKLSTGKGNVIKRIEDLRYLGARASKDKSLKDKIDYGDECEIIETNTQNEDKNIANLEFSTNASVNDEGFLAPKSNLNEISNNATSLNSDILNDNANEQKASSQNNLASQNIQIEMLNKSKQNEEEVKTIRKKGFKICEPNEQNQNLQASDESSSKRNLKARQSKQNAQLNGAAFSISDAN